MSVTVLWDDISCGRLTLRGLVTVMVSIVTCGAPIPPLLESETKLLTTVVHHVICQSRGMQLTEQNCSSVVKKLLTSFSPDTSNRPTEGQAWLFLKIRMFFNV